MDFGQPYQLGDVFQLPPPSKREATYANLRGEEPTKTVSTSVTPVKRVVSSAPNQPQQRIGSGGDIDSLISDYQRQRNEINDKYDKLLEVPDYSKVSQYAKERSAKGANALLLALAAQQGGEETKPIGAMYLKQASEARNPMKVASGYIDENGVYTEDPDARREIEAKRLENRVKGLDTNITGLTAKKEQMQNAKEMKQLALSVAAANRQSAAPNYHYATDEKGQEWAFNPATGQKIATGITKAVKEVKPGAAEDSATVLKMLDMAEAVDPKTGKNLLQRATGSGVGAMRDVAGNFFGSSSDAAEAASQMKAIEGIVISKMPKMSGPQSDKDVLLYRQMAGQLGDPTVPTERKQAAAKALREINSRYDTEGNPITPGGYTQTVRQPAVEPGTKGMHKGRPVVADENGEWQYEN